MKESPLNKDAKIYHLRWTDEIFRIGKYEETIKFDEVWRYHNVAIVDTWLE